MKKIIVLFVTIFTIQSLMAQVYKEDNPLAHTYSIVAYDTATGDFGVAVQSHWFSVGSIVTWAEAGVGAIATQSFVNPDFGPQGLALLKAGLTAEQTVNALVATDKGEMYRQLAIVDANGNVAVHTGDKCIKAAGHQTGIGFSVQANMMKNDSVWGAMATAYEASSDLPLAERMVAAMEAAQSVGGDIRGQQSAAILVVRAKSTGKVWQDRLVDLRVEDHETPIVELKRLLKVHRAYEHMNNGDVAMEHGEIEKAIEEYGAAEALFPENIEMQYWHAVNLVNAGKLKEALPMFKTIFAANEDWRLLTERLIEPGLLNVNEKELQTILKQ